MAEIRNEVERRILLRYAAGDELANIGKTLGVDQERVVEVISELAGFQRGRARELVRQYEAAHAPKPQTVPLAAVPEVKVELRSDVSRSPVEAVLARAASAGGRYAKRAAKIREQITALDADLADHQQVIDQECQVQELRRQLDEANAKLRALKTGAASLAPVSAPAVNGKEERRRIRQWAGDNGIPCPARGYIPAAVMEAYRAAHGEAAA